MADADVFALPTYESARLPNAWPYIIPYLSRKDLVSLSLVSRKFRGIAQGALWSEPRTHWTQEDSSIVDCLHTFIDALAFSQRSEIRPYLYVQTLDLSHLGSESLCFTFSQGWVSRLLQQLPTLRAFIISYTDAFDHGCVDSISISCEYLRLLSIVSCPNLTPQALNRILKSAPYLYYLEVSECPRARGTAVIQTISDMSRLGVLKLAHSGYSDEDFISFARSVIALRADPNNPLPQNIRSLDISGNSLSDAILDSLKFLGEALPSDRDPPPYDADDLDDLESSALISSPENGWSTFFEARLDHDDAHPGFNDKMDVVARAVRSPSFQSPVEAGRLGEGLTHLYISGNSLSDTSIVTLLRTLSLEKLDCGDISRMQQPTTRTLNAIPATISAARSVLDAVSECTTLKDLRIGHQLVTGFLGCDSIESGKTDSNEELPPYPYSWLRHQGTQWDPMAIRGLAVKMFQFSPAILALDRLTLTTVPQTTSSKDLAACLIAFLEAAGDMQNMAKQYLERKYGRAHWSEQAPSPKGTLREIQLEVLTFEQPRDRYEEDTETYESAAQQDFSFFPDERDLAVTTSKLREASIGGSVTLATDQAVIDVVAEISKFRRQQREIAARDGASEKRKHAIWTGKLGLVRTKKG